jgi:hypothetical protein
MKIKSKNGQHKSKINMVYMCGGGGGKKLGQEKTKLTGAFKLPYHRMGGKYPFQNEKGRRT